LAVTSYVALILLTVMEWVWLGSVQLGLLTHKHLTHQCE